MRAAAFLLTVAVVRSFAPATRHRLATRALFSMPSENDPTAKQRQELKQQLLAAADEFKSIQADMNAAALKAEDDNVEEEKPQRLFYLKLIRRIVAKIMGKKKRKPRRESTCQAIVLNSDVSFAHDGYNEFTHKLLNLCVLPRFFSRFDSQRHSWIRKFCNTQTRSG